MRAAAVEGDWSSICSSLSSDEIRSRGAHSDERLTELLVRPREDGGYGCRLNYSEFKALARSLGWNSEDIDDCWYDILMGHPSAEATDMQRVADAICSYCLASPLPLLEQYSAKQTERTEKSMRGNCMKPHQHHHSDRGHHLSADPNPPVTPATPISAPPSSKELPASAAPKAKRRSSSFDYHRYAIDTASSEQRRRISSSSCRRSQSEMKQLSIRSSTPNSSSARRTARADGDVFSRLYASGMELHRKKEQLRCTAKEEVYPFAPSITPYTSSNPDRPQQRYNKPTKSYRARLMGEEKDTDAVLDAPSTPRVNFHPAPGPSSAIPVGYVEGVARLRRYVASRSAQIDFAETLRRPHAVDPSANLQGPILRLPIKVEGVANTVDVRLASESAPAAHEVHQTPPLVEHALSDRSSSAATRPRSIRYKEHDTYY